MKKTFNALLFALGIFIVAILAFLGVCLSYTARADMPFYGLNPQETVLRAEFSTNYASSSVERKHNIYLAAKSLNNCFIDVNAEFSFNSRVGERSSSRGYKTAKIIYNGKFIDGVGGGVCQVSTTLYNAALLSGLTVTEYHAHSLPVSYVEPSFDAMVNSGSADLKFVNNTDNPIIIKTYTDGNRLTVKIFGQKMEEKYLRKSVIKENIPAPAESRISDEKGEFPDLYEGEVKFISYSKGGYKSEGYLVKVFSGGKEEIKVRKDVYSPTRGVVIEGRAKRPQENFFIEEDGFDSFLTGDLYGDLNKTSVLNC